ncbi:MAG TPA: DUF4446 family protein [Symbiobacteriaceae bacterium]
MNALLNMDSLLLAGIAVLISVLLLIFAILIYVRQNRLLKRYRMLLSGETGRDLEQLLLQQQEAIARLEGEVAELHHRVAELAEQAKTHVQKVGIVRFNPFPDTGSDLSFAVALLDAEDNGVVVTSLYGRSESRTYAKPLTRGVSRYQLTDEEKEAIQRARSGDLRRQEQVAAR